jgi:CubicO group peptidase (beta-lactamase class C family)
MTKPITSLAVLKLMENSDLKLSDPIKKYLPDFSDMLVAKDGSYDSQLKPAIRDITLFDLLTHTSGLTYTSEITGVGDIANTYRDLDIFTLDAIIESDTGTLEEHTNQLAQLPLVAQPGQQFIYSVGIDVAGRIIEIVSGKSLRDYLKEEILIPLKMNDTDFYVSEEKQNRLARLYSPLKRTYQIPGTPKMYQPTNLIPKEMKNFGIKTSMYSGGAGLISTAVDYSKFLQFLLERKEKNALGLSQASFDRILTDQLGSKLGPDLMVPAMGEFAKNQVFSLGLGVSLDSSAARNKNTPYDYLYWSGAYSTHAWIDPSTGVYGIFMTQLFPLIMMTPDLQEVADRLVTD